MPMGKCREEGGWHGKFKGCGYRFTAGREAVLDVLSVSTEHLSAEDIYFKVHERFPHIGLTTVYRTLDVLAHLGMICKYDFCEGRARYELADGPEGKSHHHHLICTSCGRVVNYTDFIDEELELLKKTERNLNRKYHFTITNHIVQFYGLCETCGAKG